MKGSVYHRFAFFCWRIFLPRFWLLVRLSAPYVLLTGWAHTYRYTTLHKCFYYCFLDCHLVFIAFDIPLSLSFGLHDFIQAYLHHLFFCSYKMSTYLRAVYAWCLPYSTEWQPQKRRTERWRHLIPFYFCFFHLFIYFLRRCSMRSVYPFFLFSSWYLSFAFVYACVRVCMMRLVGYIYWVIL